VPRRGDAKQTTGDRLGLMVLSSVVLAVLLMVESSRADSWSCCGSGEHHTTLVCWVWQESKVRNPM